MKGIRPLQLCFPGYNQAALAQVDPLAAQMPFVNHPSSAETSAASVTLTTDLQLR